MKITSLQNPKPVTPDEKKAWKAACDFEAIFVRQLFKEMGTPKDAVLGEDKDAGREIYQDMFHSHLADAAAKTSSLGLARMLYPNILRQGTSQLQALEKASKENAATAAAMKAYTGGTRNAPEMASSFAFPTTAQSAALNDLTAQASQVTGVSQGLLRSMIQVESGGNAAATSVKGARGLMQLMPDTARELGVTNPADPAQSVMGGARYMAQLLKRFGGDESKALAAYNAGPATVEKFGGIPPYAETQKYVQRVQALRPRFEAVTP